MSITEKILCSKSHEYLLDNENGTYTVGLRNRTAWRYCIFGASGSWF